MATFQAQVEGLTSLSIGTTPTTAELTQFLRDGVLDVTDKWLVGHPQDREQFQRESSPIENNGDLDLKGASIISVMRENEADGSSDGSTAWRPCRKIPSTMQSQVVDTESLSFASKYHPVYTIIDFNEVHVYPTPDGTNDSFKVFYVNHIPKDLTNSADLAYTHSDIKYFPTNKVYLVVLYASIKTVGAVMGNSVISLTAVPPDVPTLSTVSFSETNSLSITATDPTAISLTTVDYNAASATASTILTDLTPPTYDKPYLDDIADATALSEANDNTTKLHRFSEEFTSISDLSIKAVPPDVPSLTSISYSGPDATDAVFTSVVAGGVLGSSTQPSYNDSVASAALLLVTSTIVEANDFIDNNEDVELASAKLSEVQAKINEANLIIQNELNEFNEENIKYQASVQESMAEFQSQNQINLQNASNSNNRLLQSAVQDAKVILDNNAQAIQKYQAEIAEYQAEVGMEVQEYQANWSKQLQEWNGYQSTVLQHYQIELQNELNEFNKENAAFQYEVQKALADANATNQIAMQNGVQEARDAIENNNAEVQRFQAMAQHYSTQVNEDVQAYTSQLQGDVQQMQADLAANQNLLAKYQTEISEYQAEVAAETQEQSTKMQQYQLLYNQLKAEYDAAFMVAAPRQQPQQQVRA